MAAKFGVLLGTCIERVHLEFCKSLLGVKKCTLNNFVYGELKCWVKYYMITTISMFKKVYNMLNYFINKAFELRNSTIYVDNRN